MQGAQCDPGAASGHSVSFALQTLADCDACGGWRACVSEGWLSCRREDREVTASIHVQAIFVCTGGGRNAGVCRSVFMAT
ncbi:MAG: hypothetical protein ACKPJJ_15430, partial [Planctomycetaceae bacterium]